MRFCKIDGADAITAPCLLCVFRFESDSCGVTGLPSSTEKFEVVRNSDDFIKLPVVFARDLYIVIASKIDAHFAEEIERKIAIVYGPLQS